MCDRGGSGTKNFTNLCHVISGCKLKWMVDVRAIRGKKVSKPLPLPQKNKFSKQNFQWNSGGEERFRCPQLGDGGDDATKQELLRGLQRPQRHCQHQPRQPHRPSQPGRRWEKPSSQSCCQEARTKGGRNIIIHTNPLYTTPGPSIIITFMTVIHTQTFLRLLF